jgi:hypothetical protein
MSELLNDIRKYDLRFAHDEEDSSDIEMLVSKSPE